jgi:hypothetical protein
MYNIESWCLSSTHEMSFRAIIVPTLELDSVRICPTLRSENKV